MHVMLIAGADDAWVTWEPELEKPAYFSRHCLGFLKGGRTIWFAGFRLAASCVCFLACLCRCKFKHFVILASTTPRPSSLPRTPRALPMVRSLTKKQPANGPRTNLYTHPEICVLACIPRHTRLYALTSGRCRRVPSSPDEPLVVQAASCPSGSAIGTQRGHNNISRQ